jgi:single-stranded DNA-binding protein
MNFVSAYAQTLEEPREVYISATATAMRCLVALPPIGNKAPTHIELNLYGKNAERFAGAPKGAHIHIYGAQLRHDLTTRTHSLHGGSVAPVNDQFPIYNDVILAGRCVKDLDLADPKVFKSTADGLIICNQSISVNTGKNQADLFNFYAINSATDKLNNAELIANFTRKGTGLTLRGRLVTESWKDEAGERRSNIKIQVSKMTLAPKASVNDAKPIQPQATVATEKEVKPLWNNNVSQAPSDPWHVASGGGLPDLPGQYGPAPELDEEPF